MPDYPKKLIEVALPLEEINAASSREKSIRHGHPSTLHLWWARRPLAAARAVLFGQLVDDPSGYVDELKKDKPAVKAAEKALKARLKVWKQKKADYDKSSESGMKVSNPGEEPNLEAVLIERERERLFKIIRELVKWENTTNESVLEPAREEIRKSWRRTCRREDKPEDTPMPPFLDPFAGGGAIPLEAQRLGLEAHASDLNPVAVLINKAMIEIPPKFAGQPPVNPDWQAKSKEEKAATTWTGAQGLAADVRYYGQWMRDEAFKRIGHLYPPYTLTQELIDSRPDLRKAGYKTNDQLTVIAWLWTRTVPSPNPALAGKSVPLVSSFWLSKKKNKEAYVDPVVENGEYHFDIRIGPPADPDKVKAGTKTGRATFHCLLSGVPIKAEYIRGQGEDGLLGEDLMAIVCQAGKARVYLPPTLEQREASKVKGSVWKPEVPMSENSRWFSPPLYGMPLIGDLFTPRQAATMALFSDLIKELPPQIKGNGSNSNIDESYIKAVVTLMTLTSSKAARFITTLSFWRADEGKLSRGLGQQDIQMTWDFAETNPFSGTGGDLEGLAKGTASVIEKVSPYTQGHAIQKNVQDIAQKETCILSTDPPYYDNIGYADLSDYFYVWLRRGLRDVYPELFGTITVPKEQELVACPVRHGGKKEADQFFLSGMEDAMKHVLDASLRTYPITVYYAYRQTEKKNLETIITGWATFLESLMSAGYRITGTWPVRTEGKTRMIAMGTNALASSIVLVCRQRLTDAPMATRREFVQTLLSELPAALRDLQQGNIAPVDLPQSSIGPGMAIFSRYSKIVEADGSPMPVRTALQLINQTVDEFLSEQESLMDGWTRFAVTWFSQHGFESGPFGDAQNIATAKNVSVDGVAMAGILESGGGKVRILNIEDLPEDWDPGTDDRLTVWEIVHHLARRLENEGVDGAATILKQVGGLAEDARALCYRLYTICEQNKWADEARAYNSLITEWPEITRQAESLDAPATPTQQDLI